MLFSSKLKKIYQKIFPQKFDNFYKSIKNKNKLDEDLVFITEKFINSDSYQFVSNQWHLLNIIDYKNILNTKLENLGAETFNHYFNFYDYDNLYLENLFKDFPSEENHLLKSNLFKIHKGLDFKKSCNYNYLVLLLYFKLKKSLYFNSLDFLKDETYLNFGNPYINIEGKNICSDKLISLFDLEKIEKFYSINRNNLLEIGAGSGRLSECIISLKEIKNYTICDIPPSIFISYKRLKVAFPNKRIKLLIDVNNKEKLNDEIKNNEITFIFPHQIELIKKNFFDLTLAVDCFHEMDQKTLKYYFKNLSNISKNMYFSIWNKTKNWYSGSLFKKTERLDYNKGDYPIPYNWKFAFKENLIFPSNQIALGFNLTDE